MISFRIAGTGDDASVLSPNQVPMYILRQMRQEFPTIMADVHYRVLKKKWSNLLQQYKELKNPVHGDKNKADDVSWPFYSAIDEVLGYSQRENEEDVNPQEFLYVSVMPEDVGSPEDETRPGFQVDGDLKDAQSVAALQRVQPFKKETTDELERLPPSPKSPKFHSNFGRHDGATAAKKRDINGRIIPPRATRNAELTIKAIQPSIVVKDISKLRSRNENPREEESRELGKDERPSKLRRTRRAEEQDERDRSGVERRLDEFLEYTRRRDEENRSIMMRILQAVETIADKLQ
ncbi:uncharacterized protein LOC105698256 isoform X2 [Orussus abietinus]|uniref:uncharacterized protein LOC105698256 isoform X2 n=1 Tax=Orussus abietinus TaxID=222816 RepID=UPI000626CB33|nr:uncharacterized protein LOC105698256 isoform X2 [Orussus abietinus]